MRASRGMGALSPSKVPRAARRGDSEPVPSFAGGNWIQGAIKAPGSLRKALGAKEGQPIPEKKLAKAAKAPGVMGKRARLAETLKGFK